MRRARYADSRRPGGVDPRVGAKPETPAERLAYWLRQREIAEQKFRDADNTYRAAGRNTYRQAIRALTAAGEHLAECDDRIEAAREALK